MSTKITAVDPRVLYFVAFLVFLIGMTVPLGLPITISPTTKEMYDFVQALPAGSHASWLAGITSGQKTLLEASFIDIAGHILRRGIKLEVWCVLPDSGPIIDEYLTKLLGTNVKNHPDYGKKFVYVGVVPRGQYPFGLDNWMTGTDYYGTPLTQLPIMAEYHSYADWDLLVGSSAPDTVCGELATPLHLDKITFIVDRDNNLPKAEQYKQNGQLAGYVIGTRGAAEYELLTGVPGKALMPSNTTSLTAVYVIVLAVVSNVLYFTVERGARARAKLKQVEGGEKTK